MDISDIKRWASKTVKTITITQDVAGTSYDIGVRQFIPVEGDSLARKWNTNGVEQSYLCAPYAIANMREAGRKLAQFVDSTLEDALCFYIDDSDKLLRNTYSMAYRYSQFAEVWSPPTVALSANNPRTLTSPSQKKEERLLLRDVLRLWSASRMESRSDRICGAETLTMEPHHYEPQCDNSGLILTPPVFSAQLEIIMTSLLLKPAMKETLSRLNNLMQKNERSSWFAIYLALFLLLHNCSMLTAADNKKARKQGLEVPVNLL